MMAKKKHKKPVQAPVQEKPTEYEVTELSGWHNILIFIKLILIISVIGNIVAFSSDGISSADTADLAVNAVFLVLLVLTTVFHGYKKGVYFFFAYGILEVLYVIVISAIAAGKGIFAEAVGNRLIEYILFSALILIPTFVYYRKRMDLLKS